MIKESMNPPQRFPFSLTEMKELDREYPSRPILVPPQITLIQEFDGGGYLGSVRDLMIMASETQYKDGRWWRHGSVSLKNRRMPSYSNLKDMKRLVFGDHRWAVQVFPRDDEHVDWAGDKRRPNSKQVLHLYGCEEVVLPDFRIGGTI